LGLVGFVEHVVDVVNPVKGVHDLTLAVLMPAWFLCGRRRRRRVAFSNEIDLRRN